MLSKLFSIFLLLNNIVFSYQNCYTPTDVSNKGLVSYDNKVYDIQNYIHPGGQEILYQSIGKPLEEFFYMDQYKFHITSNLVVEQLKDIYVGDLYQSCANITDNTNTNNQDVFTDSTILFSTITMSFFMLSILSTIIIKNFNIFKQNMNTYLCGYISKDVILFYIMYIIWWTTLLILSFFTDNTLERLGIWISFNIAFTLLPIARNNVWGILLKISYNKLLKVHKLISVLCFFSVITKFVTVIIMYNPDFLFQEISNIMGTLCTIFIVLMSLLATPCIREHIFEVFYYSHKILALLIIITMSLHYILCLYFVIPSLILYTVDLILRISNTKKATYCALQNFMITEDITYSFFTITNFKNVKMYPGCYFFICCKNISNLEWHPLSLISNEDDNLLFCMKNLGQNSWSNKLKNFQNNKKIYDTVTVYFQGPYKYIELDYNKDKYEYILNISNGIGITPFFSILKDINNLYLQKKLTKLKKVTFVWIIPEVSLLSLPFIDRLKKFTNIVEFYIYITKKSRIDINDNIEENIFTLINFKPNIKDYIEDFIKNKNIEDTKNMCIITCGSPTLVKDIQEVSVKHNIEVFNETFS